MVCYTSNTTNCLLTNKVKKNAGKKSTRCRFQFYAHTHNCISYSISILYDKYELLKKHYQRWSARGRPWPRGHILKSLALASKVKSLALALASRPQVLENWPVFGSRTALFFELLKFCGAIENFLENVFLWRSPEKFL